MVVVVLDGSWSPQSAYIPALTPSVTVFEDLHRSY